MERFSPSRSLPPRRCQPFSPLFRTFFLFCLLRRFAPKIAPIPVFAPTLLRATANQGPSPFSPHSSDKRLLRSKLPVLLCFTLPWSFLFLPSSIQDTSFTEIPIARTELGGPGRWSTHIRLLAYLLLVRTLATHLLIVIWPGVI